MNTLEYLWPWLCDIAQNARASVPLVIHSQSGDRDGWGQSDEEAIRSMPFSRTFLRRVDHELPLSIRSALEAIKPTREDAYAIRSARRAQWRVVSSVVKDGETDTEVVRARLGMTSYRFRVAAVSGILALRSALEHDR